MRQSVRKMLMERKKKANSQDGYNGEKMRREREENDYGDYNDYNDYADGRRGVRGTGPYGIGGRRHYPRRDYADSADYADYNDYERRDKKKFKMNYDDDTEEDMRDMGDIGLSHSEMQKWKKKMMRASGENEERFTLSQIMPVAEKIGVKFEDYDEKEYCLVVNMLYSDYAEEMKGIIPADKELMAYAKMAKAWLEDKDAAKGSEKLSLYYYFVVDVDDDDFRRR